MGDNEFPSFTSIQNTKLCISIIRSDFKSQNPFPRQSPHHALKAIYNHRSSGPTRNLFSWPKLRSKKSNKTLIRKQKYVVMVFLVGNEPKALVFPREYCTESPQISKSKSIWLHPAIRSWSLHHFKTSLRGGSQLENDNKARNLNYYAYMRFVYCWFANVFLC